MAKPRDAMEWVEAMERQDADFKRRVDEELAAMEIEQQLHDLREIRGLSQHQLARTLGVTQQAIAKAESGEAKNIELRTLLRHVMALGGRLEVRIVAAESQKAADTVGSKTVALMDALRQAVEGVTPGRKDPKTTHPKSTSAARSVPRSATTKRRAASR